MPLNNVQTCTFFKQVMVFMLFAETVEGKKTQLCCNWMTPEHIQVTLLLYIMLCCCTVSQRLVRPVLAVTLLLEWGQHFSPSSKIPQHY